jgi:hypothetical protein
LALAIIGEIVAARYFRVNEFVSDQVFRVETYQVKLTLALTPYPSGYLNQFRGNTSLHDIRASSAAREVSMR